MRSTSSIVLLPLAASLSASVDAADVDSGAGYVSALDRIVVTATRAPRELADVPNTVDAISREEMDARLVRDLRELFRFEPGITVTEGFGRFGIGDIRIRGLGGNRVRLQVDGVAVSDAFSIGSFSNANRNFVDLDTLKQVEVVRGPTSSLYGSDALGGTVAFITKDPRDYLTTADDTYVGLRLGFDGDWSGLHAGTTIATGGERWSALINVAHRQGKERDNQAQAGGEGGARTRPNPQERDGRSLLTKWMFEPSDDQRFKLSIEGNEDRASTELLTMQGPQALTGATNTAVGARDLQTRARISLAHEWDALERGFADSLDWQLYRQDSETTQDTFELRSLPPPTLRDRRDRSFNFDQRLLGLQLNLRKQIATDATSHALAYGLDLRRTQTAQKRDGLRTFLQTGATTSVLSPDAFPVRDFPLSRTTDIGLYVQDEVSLLEGRLRLIPALRWDHYQLDPTVDAIFRADNPGVAVSELSESKLSPKLGLVWSFATDLTLFGGYARGFRSPPYNDVNIGFTNVQFGYTAIANPELEAETSDGIEWGLRYAGKAVWASATTYYTRYDNFIESLSAVSQPPQTPLIVFQSRNVAEARIYGADFKSGADLGALGERLAGWSLRGSLAWSRGDDLTADKPLDSVDPLTATLGLAYTAQTWGMELASRLVARKRRASDPALFRQPGFGVLDLYGHWQFAPAAKLYAGVFNLADRRYFDIGNLPLVVASSSVLDRYTAPGRHLGLSLALEW